jgi:hypothetical protein
MESHHRPEKYYDPFKEIDNLYLPGENLVYGLLSIDPIIA